MVNRDLVTIVRSGCNTSSIDMMQKLVDEGNVRDVIARLHFRILDHSFDQSQQVRQLVVDYYCPNEERALSALTEHECPVSLSTISHRLLAPCCFKAFDLLSIAVYLSRDLIVRCPMCNTDVYVSDMIAIYDSNVYNTGLTYSSLTSNEVCERLVNSYMYTEKILVVTSRPLIANLYPRRIDMPKNTRGSSLYLRWFQSKCDEVKVLVVDNVNVLSKKMRVDEVIFVNVDNDTVTNVQSNVSAPHYTIIV